MLSQCLKIWNIYLTLVVLFLTVIPARYQPMDLGGLYSTETFFMPDICLGGSSQAAFFLMQEHGPCMASLTPSLGRELQEASSLLTVTCVTCIRLSFHSHWLGDHLVLPSLRQSTHEPVPKGYGALPVSSWLIPASHTGDMAFLGLTSLQAPCTRIPPQTYLSNTSSAWVGVLEREAASV